MKDKKEIKEWLIENATNENGDIDLGGINFEHRIVYLHYISGRIIRNDSQRANSIHNRDQHANEIHNNDQEAVLISNDYQWATEINNKKQTASFIYNNLQKETGER